MSTKRKKLTPGQAVSADRTAFRRRLMRQRKNLIDVITKLEARKERPLSGMALLDAFIEQELEWIAFSTERDMKPGGIGRV